MPYRMTKRRSLPLDTDMLLNVLSCAQFPAEIPANYRNPMCATVVNCYGNRSDVSYCPRSIVH
jgi:hypothetical protein